jgi:hypothetical protein
MTGDPCPQRRSLRKACVDIEKTVSNEDHPSFSLIVLPIEKDVSQTVRIRKGPFELEITSPIPQGREAHQTLTLAGFPWYNEA